MSRLRLIKILLFSFIGTGVFAQNSDSVRADSVIRHSYIPTGIRVGTDLISIVQSQIDDNRILAGFEQLYICYGICQCQGVDSLVGIMYIKSC